MNCATPTCKKTARYALKIPTTPDPMLSCKQHFADDLIGELSARGSVHIQFAKLDYPDLADVDVYKVIDCPTK